MSSDINFDLEILFKQITYICRDLGTSLNNLQTLWMAKCGLADLDGISSLCSIKVRRILENVGYNC